MAEPVKDSTLTNTNARLTADKGVGIDNYVDEQIQYVYKNGMIVGVDCKGFNELSDTVIQLNKPETKSTFNNTLERQYQVLFAGLISYKYTSTSCLLKAAGSFHQLLMLLITLPDDKRVPPVIDALLSIYNELEKRTKKPYQYRITFDDKDLYRPLPVSILSQYPFEQLEIWKKIQQKIKDRPSGNAKKRDPYEGLIPIMEKEPAPANEKEIENAIEAAEANIKITAELASIPTNDTPLITLYRENLTKLTLEDVYKQTGFRRTVADWKLSELIDIIYYVSSFTIVLDKNGEPFGQNGIYGFFPYGMILPSRKFKTVKFIPVPGNYISLGPFTGQQFEFKGGIIKKLPIQYNGILGYQEVWATGQWEPEWQVESNKTFGKKGLYLGSLVVMSAFGSKDIGIFDMVTALPEVVEETMPYFYKVIEKKIKEWFDNAADLLKEMLKEALKNVVVATLKKIAVKYIIKKIGKKVIPGVNLAAAIKDAVDAIRGEDSEVDTIAINCVRLYLKAINQDDKTLSVKILANIMGDEFESEIKNAIIKHATNLGLKAVDKVKGKVSAPEQKPVEHPKPVQEPTPAPTAETKKPAVTTQANNKPGTIDPKAIQEGYNLYKEAGQADKKEKEKQTDKKKEQGTDNKTITRPQDEEKQKSPIAKDKGEEAEPKKEKAAMAATSDKGHTGDEKKKAMDARLALIKERQKALDKAKAEEKKKEERKTKDKKTEDKKVGTQPFDPDKASKELAEKGKKARAGSARKRARQQAIDEARESLLSGNPTPQALHLAKRLEEKYGRDAVEKFKETGKLPRDIEFSHLFSLSEYPEFGHRGDLGVLTDADEHRRGHHGGNTRDPLHGYPKKPGKDEPDDDNDDE